MLRRNGSFPNIAFLCALFWAGNCSADDLTAPREYEGRPIESVRFDPQLQPLTPADLGRAVSFAPGTPLHQDQIRDAIKFLERHKRQLRRLSRLPGVETLTLDFGVARRDVPAQFDYFPPNLLLAAGKLGIGLELSWYHAFSGA